MSSFLHEEYEKLLIGYRPKPPSAGLTHDDPATFHVAASAYSLGQRAFVAHSDEALVWYDYDKPKKCHPGEDVMAMIWKRVKKV